jgi:hypothetical protein
MRPDPITIRGPISGKLEMLRRELRRHRPVPSAGTLTSVTTQGTSRQAAPSRTEEQTTITNNTPRWG